MWEGAQSNTRQHGVGGRLLSFLPGPDALNEFSNVKINLNIKTNKQTNNKNNNKNLKDTKQLGCCKVN